MTQSDPQTVVDLNFPLEPREVVRIMGCGPNRLLREDLQARVNVLIEESRNLIEARGVYVIRDVARMTDAEITLQGCPPLFGPIAGFLKPARRVAVYVVTIGPRLEQRARELMGDGEIADGFILDAIGSAAAELAVDALADHILWTDARPDEAITPPFSPGYCGMAVDEQKTLFAIVDGGRVGVRLWPTMFMEPVKSVSGLLGLGDRDQVDEHGVPCQWCDLDECRMRRSG
jgi:hypothetical protein